MNRKFSAKSNEKGQGLVEYVLTAILAGLVGAGVWMAFAPEIKAVATSVIGGVTGEYSVHDGVVIIPGIGPSLTPTGSLVPIITSTPIPTFTPTATFTSTATSAPTFTPAPTATPVGIWTNCANENGFCSFSGTAQVRYGAGEVWVIQTHTDGVSCTNAIFGDPVWGVAKTCQVYQITLSTPIAPPIVPTSTPPSTLVPTSTPSPTLVPTSTPSPITTWITCANEGGFCSFSGTAQVRYGANGVWVTQTFTNGVACTNAVFGDPISGVVKTCEVSQVTVASPTPVPQWTDCATQYGFCSFTGTYPVRFGKDSTWVTQTHTDGVACSTAIFGNPIWGTKKCQVYK
jgi:hypothetical protein